MANLIKLHKINKTYHMGEESLHVLKDVSLEIAHGESLCILGPSGSGKTTLMNVIGCMDTADCGSYLLNGCMIEQCGEDELAQIRNRDIGFVFQNYNLIPQYNILQNVMMPLLMRGSSSEDATREATKQIDLVGLMDRLPHKPGELSGGQQQRVAIARALVSQPKLILADEPTGALDSETGREILELFQKLNAQGKTIITISHDRDVAKHSSRIVRLLDGRIA